MHVRWSTPQTIKSRYFDVLLLVTAMFLSVRQPCESVFRPGCQTETQTQLLGRLVSVRMNAEDACSSSASRVLSLSKTVWILQQQFTERSAPLFPHTDVEAANLERRTHLRYSRQYRLGTRPASSPCQPSYRHGPSVLNGGRLEVFSQARRGSDG